MPDMTHSTAVGNVVIHLDDVSKCYPGQADYAVKPLSLDVRQGEFVVLVGPSGCGKTTTLRMINRLVEPTAGRIWIDGNDVTDVDPTQLRRTIGYVIQQVGLLPHMSITENVGLVPKLLGWNRGTIGKRVDELLDLVGLDPSVYRERYPKQLSGGQQQRVGVARALAADPPVMLMDEPFGAIDPITRERLQDEFLDLQQRIRKTIVFVTHDIDEALKLGDRIAIFDGSSQLAQFATPLEILSEPADEHVQRFVGAGAELRRLTLLRVAEVSAGMSTADSTPHSGTIQADEADSVYAVLERSLRAGTDSVVVSGNGSGGQRTLSVRDLLLAAARSGGGPRS